MTIEDALVKRALAKIRGKRCELKLTQKEVAKALKISEKTYSCKENGISSFTFNEIFIICSIFRCHISDFF